VLLTTAFSILTVSLLLYLVTTGRIPADFFPHAP
jgi:hypothetical protein